MSGLHPRLLGTQRQVRRERHEPLLRAVVDVALEPLPFDVGGVDQPRARRPEPAGERLALADDGRHRQRRHSRHHEVQLRVQHGAAHRVEHERAVKMGRAPDRQSGRDHDRERRAAGPETQRGPDQRGEHDVADSGRPTSSPSTLSPTSATSRMDASSARPRTHAADDRPHHASANGTTISAPE